MEMKFHGGDNGEPFIIEYQVEDGFLLESHKHEHPHLSVLVSGTAAVTIDGITELKTGYCTVSVPGNTYHQVVAITPIVWLCIWPGDHAESQKTKGAPQILACME